MSIVLHRSKYRFLLGSAIFAVTVGMSSLAFAQTTTGGTNPPPPTSSSGAGTATTPPPPPPSSSTAQPTGTQTTQSNQSSDSWQGTNPPPSGTTNPPPSNLSSSSSSNQPPASNQCPQGQFLGNGSCTSPQQGCSQMNGTWVSDTTPLGGHCQMPNQTTQQNQNQFMGQFNPQQWAGQPQSFIGGVNGSSTGQSWSPNSNNGGFNRMPFNSQGQGQFMPPQSGGGMQGNSPQFQGNLDHTGFGDWSHGAGKEVQGPNDQGGDMGQGNSQFEAEQAKMMAQQAKQMAKGLNRSISRLKRQIGSLTKRGLTATTDCQTALTDATNLVNQLSGISSSQDSSAVSDLVSSVQDMDNTISECSGTVNQLLSLPGMMKLARSMLAKLSKGGGDTSTVQPEFDQLSSEYDSIKSGSASSDDLDSFYSDMDGFRTDMEAAFSDAGLLMSDSFRNMQFPERGNQGSGQMMDGGMHLNMPSQNFQGGDNGGNLPNSRPSNFNQDTQPSAPGATGPQSNAELNDAQKSQLGSVYEALLQLKKLFQ